MKLSNLFPTIWSIFHRDQIVSEQEFQQETLSSVDRQVRDWIWDTPIGTILKLIIKK